MKKEYAKVLESKALIRFEDCDPFGHLNNGRYIDYYLNAREDQLRDNYDLDIYALGKTTGKAWVVASNQLAYLREVKFMETVTIRTCLRWYSSSDLMMEGQMVDPKTGAIISVIWTRFTYVDIRKGLKAEHSEELTTLFSSVAILGVGKPAEYFEDRVKELRMAPVLQP
ncbi:thioesterase family protein [Pontibacter sp. HSC-36F09]|uniref:acyl-CoA thioesterase n=1 Tax=Pontibacter sp. HSC-36F09 TaxID=2910966 RepID=UPI0020A065D9|nr:acyl-CoA thioesterase [Pontibacter sp. HSC-36F09]MCP2043953.1 acyl-CoA thioester hydrolase [Pontibacter sp. HSC-36F09]